MSCEKNILSLTEAGKSISGRETHMKRKSIFICGLITGLAASMSLTAFGASAIQTISAQINDNFRFVFNDQQRIVPPGYHTIIYQGSSYVPAKFVGESLGATVLWDDASKTVSFTSPPPKEVIVTVPAVAAPAPAPEKEEEEEEDDYNYRKLPQTKDMDGYRVSVTSYSTDEKQNYGNMLGLKIVNSDAGTVQLNQSKTEFISGGETYTLTSKDAVNFDTRWYSDIGYDETVEGYLRMPVELKDAKNVHVELLVHTNRNSRTEDDVIEFDIELPEASK
jgi:hypothetical protein